MNIAIVRRNGLGDFIAGTLPMYYCMKEDNIGGKNRFFLFLSKSNFPLFKYFIEDENTIVERFHKGNKYLSMIMTAIKYRKIIDVGYLTIPDYPKLTGLFLLLMGVKIRYGYINNSCIPRLTINKGIEDLEAFKGRDKHVALFNLQLYKPQIEKIEKRWYPKFNQSKIKDFNLEINGPFLMVELSNSKNNNQLKNEKIFKILLDLKSHFEFTVLITAMPKDISKSQDLIDKLNNAAIKNYFYCTDDLDKYISYVNKADVVLVGDGGLGHISGALGKYIVALYAKTSVKRWRILSDKAVILYDDKDVNNISNKKIIKELCSCFLSINK